MKKVVLCKKIFFSFCLFFFVENAFSQENKKIEFTENERKFIESGIEIPIAVSPDMKPVQYFNEKSNSYQGIVVDFLSTIANTTDLNIVFVQRNDYDILLDEINQGKVIGIATLVDNSVIADRLNVSLSKPYFSSSVTMISNSLVKDRKDSNCKVVLKDGYPLYTQLAKIMKYKNISFCSNFEECVSLVQSGEADVTLIDTFTADNILNQNYFLNIKSVVLANSSYGFCIGISKTAPPEVKSIINKGIQSLSEDYKSNLLLSSITRNTETYTVKDFWNKNRAFIFIIVSSVLLFITILLIVFLTRIGKLNKALISNIVKTEKANKAKNDFMSRMSHDMRTPMNGIQGMTLLTLDMDDIPEKARQNLERIYSSSKFMLNLINDVLDMNKIESNKIVIHKEPVLLEKFFDDIIALIMPTIDQKRQEFKLTPINTCFDYVNIDKVRFQQVITNLLTNATNNTPEYGKIELILEAMYRTGNISHNRVIVKDNGVGMSKEFQSKLFTPFEREENSESYKNRGTGLGLPIVKNLVELMGGKIEVISELGKGTSIVINLDIEHLPEFTRKNTERKSYESLVGKKILVVEDNELNADIVKEFLVKQGIIVEVVGNGLLGVQEFSNSKNREYSAILMDISMPVMNGLDATERIRMLERIDSKIVPIIAMSANAFAEDIQKALERGMNAHIEKPFEPADLFRVLKELIVY